LYGHTFIHISSTNLLRGFEAQRKATKETSEELELILCWRRRTSQQQSHHWVPRSFWREVLHAWLWTKERRRERRTAIFISFSVGI
jgi:hypothetical protein